MTHRLDKASETARLMMSRRQMEFSEEDQLILQHIQDETARYRAWDRKKDPEG